VRDKHRDETARGPVEASPEKATGEGCKDEHRISRWKMDRGVKKGREDESGPGAPSLSEPSLHKASPEDFLPEPYGEKEQKGDKGRGEPSEVRVNRSDVLCRVWKEGRKEPGYQKEKLVPQVENGVQKSSQENSNQNILRGELSAPNERPAKGKGDGCQKRSAKGEHDPEIEGSKDEHDDPEHKSQPDAQPKSDVSFTDHRFLAASCLLYSVSCLLSPLRKETSNDQSNDREQSKGQVNLGGGSVNHGESFRGHVFFVANHVDDFDGQGKRKKDEEGKGGQAA
jgi:hypothetical protein